MKDCLSGITDWAEPFLTRHGLPARGKAGGFGEQSEMPTIRKKKPISLSCRQDLRSWAGVREGRKKKIKRKEKKKKNWSKDTLLPWIMSQLYSKDVQEADSSARQL